MPFQDIDDEATTPIPRSPTLPERWVRKILIEDWGLKLLAVAITAILWLAVTGQNEPKTLRVPGVQLNFLKQKGVEISNELPSSVEVILTGSPDKLKDVEQGGLVATVDITGQRPGERVVRLSRDHVRMDLPPGVKIQGFQPSSLPIRLEPSAEAQIDVEIKFEGKLPEGYELTGFSTSPAKIRVSGPSDHVTALRKATTETVWLDGKTESFSLSNVAINIPDPKIDVLDPIVNLRVEITQRMRSEVHLRFATGEASQYIARISAPAQRRSLYSHFRLALS
jgi:YbbR domain-containing protein